MSNRAGAERHRESQHGHTNNLDWPTAPRTDATQAALHSERTMNQLSRHAANAQGAPETALIRLGLISDTHGLLRPGVHTVFKDVDVILHAGDVCGDDILHELRAIAPVHAVAGNCDPIDDPNLPLSFEHTFEKVRLHMSHGHELGRPKPEEMLKRYADADVIVYGHTHHQLLFESAGGLVVNPGSAGPRRFNMPPGVAVMKIDEERVSVELIALE